jgi:acetolactate synthase small subunit
MSQHTLRVLLHHHPDLFDRTVRRCHARGVRLTSVTLEQADIPGLSQLTVVASARDATVVASVLDEFEEVLHAPPHFREQADGAPADEMACER